MTSQEMFDKVTEHLLTQMEKSQNVCGCLYRGPRGLKCAIGALIPDELYKPEMEFGAVCKCPALGKSTLATGIAVKAGIEDLELAGRLQNIHDGIFPEHWEERLRELAETHKLTFNWGNK